MTYFRQSFFFIIPAKKIINSYFHFSNLTSIALKLIRDNYRRLEIASFIQVRKRATWKQSDNRFGRCMALYYSVINIEPITAIINEIFMAS